MAFESQYNQRNPAVKRLMKEAQELKDPTDGYYAQPLEDNLFEWHFTVHGSPDTEYSGGVYHGRIILPPEYPMKPPNIILLTPNGRFETYKKICLSISGHHPETWQPSWSIRTALLALIAFMSSPGRGSIGALDYSPEERRKLAIKSQSWTCSICGPIAQLLRAETPQVVTQEEQELVKCINLKAEENSETAPSTDSQSTPSTEPQTTPSTEPQATPEPVEPDNSSSNDSSAAYTEPPMRIHIHLVPERLGRLGDLLLCILVAAIALLVARRIALAMFL